MKVTPEQLRAIRLARSQGTNKLHRHRGGFWSHHGWVKGQEYIGTNTIQALVRKGLVVESSFKVQYGRAVSFCIEAELTEKAKEIV
jgi:hypothetical protein